MGYRVAKEKRWPNKKIPYTFHENVDDELKKLFKDCMERWESFINAKAIYVQFVERTNEESYVEVSVNERGSTGTGELGKPPAKNVLKFTINTTIANGRDDRQSIPHELGHLMGLVHEHQRSRPDFDAKGNPLEGTGDEVTTEDAAKARLYYFCRDFEGKPDLELKKMQLTRWNANFVACGPYDLQSLMHYPEGPTWQWNYKPYRNVANAIAALNYPSAAQVLAGKWAPSAGDIAALQELYS